MGGSPYRNKILDRSYVSPAKPIPLSRVPVELERFLDKASSLKV